MYQQVRLPTNIQLCENANNQIKFNPIYSSPEKLLLYITVLVKICVPELHNYSLQSM